jgi:hypothetical protein
MVGLVVAKAHEVAAIPRISMSQIYKLAKAGDNLADGANECNGEI